MIRYNDLPAPAQQVISNAHQAVVDAYELAANDHPNGDTLLTQARDLFSLACLTNGADPEEVIEHL